MSKWKLWLIPLMAVLAFGVYKGTELFWNNNNDEQPARVHTVQLAEVSRINTEKTLSLTGTVEAWEEALISPKVAGRVARVAVENGAGVAVGQQLVLLDNEEYHNAVTITRTELKKAEVGLNNARVNYERYSELHREGAISKKDFEDMEIALAMAEAEVDAAAAGLDNAERALRDTAVTSPISGVVANRNVTTGQVVSPGMPLISVLNISSVYIVVNIEQNPLSMIKPGLKAEVAVDGYGDKMFDGVVEIINPAANRAAWVFETKIKVDNKDRLLKPGMFARVEINTGNPQEVAVVPREALSGNKGMFFVFVAEGDKAVRQDVEIGQIVNGLVEIKAGLEEGQQVLVTNVNKLKDGDSIAIAD